MVKNEEYCDLYNYEDDYEELNESENPEDAIERLRNTIGRGDCLYCGGKSAMLYDGHICFICSKCGKSIHEDLYYRWAAGYDV